jgi:hypothetical protein
LLLKPNHFCHIGDQPQLVIIEKDLKRLPHPAEDKHPSGALSQPDNTPEHEARLTSLREILYIYAQEHPAMGYRQGMHEIASFLLFVLELEHQNYPDHVLFNPILPICYGLLERTLDHLKTAYDATGGKSLQQMSIAILGKILQNDQILYHHLTANPNIPPPPIYCTRWVRLMFSREVVGYENVFKLWDVFFSYANVMNALEIASAGRVLLLRDALLLPDSNTLDLLMNVPPLADITAFSDVVKRLMHQKEGDDAVLLPQTLSAPSIQQQNNRQQSLGPQPHFPGPFPLGHTYNSPEQSMIGSDSKFSFSKMRQSLGQKVDSLGQKIAIKTNEWKEAAARRESSGSSIANAGSSSSHSFDPLGGIKTHAAAIGRQPVVTNAHSSSHIAGPSTHNITGIQTSGPNASLKEPKSPRQHQHERWSQLLQQKIFTVQEFLIALESKENEGTVPSEVWEALADMDRMQRELLNYSRSMAGSSY